MGRLMVASDWAEKRFAEGSRPDMRTVRSWVAKGTVPGRIIGKLTYVDDDAFMAGPAGTGDAMADRILAELDAPSGTTRRTGRKRER